MSTDKFDFNKMYLMHRVALGATREEAHAGFRAVCYAYLQDTNWRDPASSVHPHRLAQTHHDASTQTEGSKT